MNVDREAKEQDALSELRQLTTCRCEPAWTDRGLHETHCNQDYAKDVETLGAALARNRELEGERDNLRDELNGLDA